MRPERRITCAPPSAPPSSRASRGSNSTSWSRRRSRAASTTARFTHSPSRRRFRTRALATMGQMTEPTLKDKVEELIRDNQILLFMKGTPEAPQCGFSMRVVNLLESYDVEEAALDVLPALQPLREVTAEISDWQTFPQLYVNGALVGGCDIVEEMD